MNILLPNPPELEAEIAEMQRQQAGLDELRTQSAETIRDDVRQTATDPFSKLQALRAKSHPTKPQIISTSIQHSPNNS